MINSRRGERGEEKEVESEEGAEREGNGQWRGNAAVDSKVSKEVDLWL